MRSGGRGEQKGGKKNREEAAYSLFGITVCRRSLASIFRRVIEKLEIKERGTKREGVCRKVLLFLFSFSSSPFPLTRGRQVATFSLSSPQGSADEGKVDGEQRGTPALSLRASPLIQKDGHVHDDGAR